MLLVSFFLDSYWVLVSLIAVSYTQLDSQCSADYDVESPITKEFFATVQNLSLIHI